MRQVQRVQYILGTADQCRTIADQDVAATGATVERVAGNGENVATLFERNLGGDQAA